MNIMSMMSLAMHAIIAETLRFNGLKDNFTTFSKNLLNEAVAE